MRLDIFHDSSYTFLASIEFYSNSPSSRTILSFEISVDFFFQTIPPDNWAEHETYHLA